MRRAAAWTLVVLAAGLALRAWGLSRRELSYYDEALHWRVAYAPAAAAREAARAVLAGAPPSRERLRAAVLAEGFPSQNMGAHHGYVALEAAAMAVAGLRDDAGFWVSATLGTLTVWIVARIGAIAGGAFTGLVAAAFVAASANHVFYSRSAFSHAASVLFVYAGALCVLESLRGRSRRLLFWGGACLGYAFTCHYNLVWTLPWVGAVVAAVEVRRAGPRGAAGACAALGLGWLLAPLAFELATRAACRLSLLPGLEPYHREVEGQFRMSLQQGYTRMVSTDGYYLLHWIRTEGPLFTAGSLAAAAWLAWRWRAAGAAGVLLAGLLLLPHAAYAGPALKASRTLLVAIPAAALCLGILAERLRMRAGRVGTIAVAGLFALAAAWPCWRSAEAARARGPYKEVLRRIEALGGAPVTVDDYPVVSVYTRGADVLVAETGTRPWRGELARIRAGERRPLYLIVRRQDGRYGFQDPVWGSRYAAVRHVVEERGQKPVFAVPYGHPVDFDLVDRELPAGQDRRRLLTLSGVENVVEVYDLAGVR